MAITVAVVRAALEPDTFKSFWVHVARDQGRPGRGCPSCEQPMREVPAEATEGRILLDACPRCQLIWFDPAELEALPAKPLKREIPDEARRMIAMEQVRLMGEDAKLQAAAERARRRLTGGGHGEASGEGWLAMLWDLVRG
jgi:Zn-finger nucleic acid-binding protein